ncbi:MAG: DUF4914 family protein [Anaerolineae bacterium]|nr:DUF4914 family protein [Anaerolineae bacterium]
MEWTKYHPPEDAEDILRTSPSVIIASTITELVNHACGGLGSNSFEVVYDIPDHGRVVEAAVCRVRNGVSVNYPEPYMRRRDPDCMVIADDKPTDKPTFKERYGESFASVRQTTFMWLKSQPLLLFAFNAGPKGMGSQALCIAPGNAGFFALGLALLQGIIPADELPPDFNPTGIIYVAPTFRHTHFEGRQVVVHNRLDNLHEMFAYNLYPGPSAKKGVYSMLLNQGERENWVTTHCSAVRIVTPYDNTVVIMHEGASGGGKSEMLEQAHRENDGRLLLGENLVTGEKRYLEIPRTCDLQPVADDMAVCHPSIQRSNGKLNIADAETAWFVRVNHINHYGTDVHLERLTAQSTEPLLFLNIDAVPKGRALIWDHIEDAPGKPCPNPRVVIPRSLVPDIVNGPVRVDIRSFGVRTPPSTRENPTYGIIGLFQILPPALAWLWRLAAPRGHENPSITESKGMSSEGVGSYWPFATGRKVDQANLLLAQFRDNTRTRYILVPSQNIGAWRVGFMPQWVTREFLARRGSAPFKPEQLRATRCPLLGYRLHHLQVEGRMITNYLTKVEIQPELGEEAYDIGAGILYDFFRKCLKEFDSPDLLPLGRQIMECCLDEGSVADYEALIPSAEPEP